MPKVKPATFSTSGTPTVKTNNPRRIIPTTLKTSFASLIAFSPLFSAPKFVGSIVRSEVYEDPSEGVPLKISHKSPEKWYRSQSKLSENHSRAFNLFRG